MSRASRKARLARRAAYAEHPPTVRYTVVIVILAAALILLLGDRFRAGARLSVPAGAPARIDACLDRAGTVTIVAAGRRDCPAGDRLMSWFQGTPASVPATAAPIAALQRG
jgi:hypothetical protein